MDGLCQAYHWSLPEATKLTLPQMIMMNHAAFVNRERSEASYEARKGTESQDNKKRTKEDSDPVVAGGKRVSQLNSAEMALYFGNFSAGSSDA